MSLREVGGVGSAEGVGVDGQRRIPCVLQVDIVSHTGSHALQGKDQ